MATCMATNNTPPEARKALDCATQHSSDLKLIGGCIVASRIGGDAGRLASCAVQSGGDFVGTAACLAGPSLTPEQQILLQCASQSADVASFAICTGGQLSMREIAKCKDRQLGEGECFGENNTIRVLSRRLGLGDIHKDTVVGQLASANLDVVKFQVRFAEATLEGAGAILEAGGEEALQLAGAAVETVKAIADGGEEVAETTLCATFGIVCDDGNKPWWQGFGELVCCRLTSPAYVRWTYHGSIFRGRFPFRARRAVLEV